MRMRNRVAARFYKSSDRTHVTPIRWLKKEREEWKVQSRDTAARMLIYMEKGDVRSALATLLSLERLEADGISTIEALDARNEFLRRCQLKPKR